MQPQEFIAKWRAVELKERSASQSHFNDLCAVLGQQDPISADPKGEWFTFEKGASKTGGGDGWADVWKRGCFAWEYKGKHANLATALKQLKLYQGALENPPLLIVSDMEKIEIHTSWTNMVQETHIFTIGDLIDGGKRARLKKAFSPTEVEAFKPGRKRADLTADVAKEFVTLAQSLRERGNPAQQVAHFVNRLVFCMFAEDVELLPNGMFKKMLQASLRDPARFQENARRLFRAMAKQGGKVGYDPIEWFNGGLFDDDEALQLEATDIRTALNAAEQDWSNIDPSIMGTLFERGLDPSKRSQLGAHYTDPEKIMMIVNPVIIAPLTQEWDTVKAQIEEEYAKAKTAREARPQFQKEAASFHRSQRQREENALRRAERAWGTFQTRLRDFRVLDPACGSGNFLYLSLKALKDIELKANQEREEIAKKYGLAIGVAAPLVGPENMLGIEINPFAAELARVSVWIGEIQWMREHGFDASRNPILKPLDTIRCHDALLNDDGSEYEWPAADVIIGNPPYLGAKLMKGRLGVRETEKIRAAFNGRLPGFTDLVCYWFEKSRTMIESGTATRVGLVATNSIRKNTNLPVMHRIVKITEVFAAWSEEQWTINGAAVDVSLICFGQSLSDRKLLDGQPVSHINADLTTGLDLTQAGALPENAGVALLGIQKSGPFDVPGDLARQWMNLPINPNGSKNAEILKPYWNGDDLTARPRDMWFIDLPLGLSEAQAALFASPFHHIATALDEDGKSIKELREALGERAGPRWWEPHWPRPEMRSRISSLRRYIVTAETAQHRLFVWLAYPVLPDKNLIVITRDDDTTFGILHSRMHALWSLRKGSDLEDRPRYTHTTTFATFPFPKGLTPIIPASRYAADPRAASIAAASKNLNQLRERWLNPADLVVRAAEIVAGFPDRILPKDDKASVELGRRTLTNLYNERPAWLDMAHKELDRAVAAAYGWADWGADGLPDDVILERLFRLNQERQDAQCAPD